MTDREKLTGLLTEWGVPFRDGYYETQYRMPDGDLWRPTHSIDAFDQATVEPVPDPELASEVFVVGDDGRDAPDSKLNGYSGFNVQFTFDADGKFLRMGIWE